MENTVNYLILCLSYINKNNCKQRFYTVDGDDRNEPIEAKQTNLAQSKYLFKLLSDKEQVFDKIIILTTDACNKINPLIAGERSTYQFFIDELMSFAINDEKIRSIVEKNYNNIDDYFRDLFAPIMVTETPDNQQKKEIFSEIKNIGNLPIGVQQDIYIDTTGGSRIANWISMFIVRFLEGRNQSNVCKVLYGNILNSEEDKGVIVDCTDTYLAFNAIEQFSKTDSLVDKYSAYIGFGLSDDETDLEILSKIDDLVKKTNGNLKISKKTDIETEINETLNDIRESLDDFMKGLMYEEIRVARANNLQNPFDTCLKLLENGQEDDAIKKFHENAIGVFVCYDIILARGRMKSPKKEYEIKNLTNLFKAITYYYINPGKSDCSAIAEIKKWLINLLNNESYDPIKCYKDRLKLQSKYYGYGSEVVNDRLNKNNKLSKINPIIEVSEKKFRNIFENDISLKNHILRLSGTDWLKSVDEYNRLQNVYFSYGFPFMCTNQYGYFYNEIRVFYNEKFKELANYLSELKKDTDNYKAELNNLIKDEAYLKEKIPFIAESELWEINASKFENPNMVVGFLENLVYRIEKIRPYRNVNAHDDNEITNKDKAVAELKAWLIEYSDIIEKSKSRGERDE